MSVYFFDEEAARAAHARLTRAGFPARIQREPFAGEDDDEDHPWLLVSDDCPAAMAELLAEEYDGWLAAGIPSHEPPLPKLDLPTGPKRRHRPECPSSDN